MPRLFTAISLPADIKQALLMQGGGIPGARWQRDDQLHLTLRFIGDVDGRQFSDVAQILEMANAKPFDISLAGIYQFGGKNPHIVWAGVEAGPAIFSLENSIDRLLQRIGLPPEQRKYTPHVTLARLKDASRRKVMEYIADHSLFKTPSFTVDAFHLYSSQLKGEGALYRVEQTYSLSS